VAVPMAVGNHQKGRRHEAKGKRDEGNI
jgi:hypothetical protein